MIKNMITIFISILMLVPAMYIIQINDADAGSRHRHRRQIRRAQAAGAVRVHRRAHVRHHVKKEHRRAVRRDRGRRAVGAAIAVGVGAAIIDNARD